MKFVMSSALRIMKNALILSSSSPRHYPWHFRGVLILTVGLLSFVALKPGWTQEKPVSGVSSLGSRVLTVTGRGQETIAATLAQVRLGVEVQGKIAEEVQQIAAQRSAAVVALLQKQNVEKLKTTGISLNPNYRYTSGQQQLVGYIATNTVSFRIDAQKAGTLIDAAVKAGASRIDGISFAATDSAITQAQQQALRKATQDAQTQADAVLSTLNFTQQGIVGIQVNAASPPPPTPMPYAALEARTAKQADTPVVGGEQQVEASVTLQIRY
jgi:hypothetical protein